MNTECVVPDWLHDIILGYGDPNAAHYSKWVLMLLAPDWTFHCDVIVGFTASGCPIKFCPWIGMTPSSMRTTWEPASLITPSGSWPRAERSSLPSSMSHHTITCKFAVCRILSHMIFLFLSFVGWHSLPVGQTWSASMERKLNPALKRMLLLLNPLSFQTEGHMSTTSPSSQWLPSFLKPK